jgi:hypothetical protein
MTVVHLARENKMEYAVRALASSWRQIVSPRPLGCLSPITAVDVGTLRKG